jgi:hypothetical protein
MPAPQPDPSGPARDGRGRCGDHQICGAPCPLPAGATVTATFHTSVFTYHACSGHANRLARSLRLLGATVRTDPGATE